MKRTLDAHPKDFTSPEWLDQLPSDLVWERGLVNYWNFLDLLVFRYTSKAYYTYAKWIIDQQGERRERACSQLSILCVLPHDTTVHYYDWLSARCNQITYRWYIYTPYIAYFKPPLFQKISLYTRTTSTILIEYVSVAFNVENIELLRYLEEVEKEPFWKVLISVVRSAYKITETQFLYLLTHGFFDKIHANTCTWYYEMQNNQNNALFELFQFCLERQ